MAATRILDLTAYSTVHSDDIVDVIDTHDTTMSAGGTDKKATLSQLLAVYQGTITATGTLKGAGSGSVSAASGTDLNTTFGSQTANYVYAAPNGSSGTPSFRALTSADITGLSAQSLQFSQVTNITVTSSGSLLSSTSALGSLTLAAGALNSAGKSLRIKLYGYFTPASVSAGNYYFYLTLGGNCVATSRSAQPLPVPGSGTFGWTGDIIITCKSTGSTGTSDASGTFWLNLREGLGTMPYWADFLNGTTAGTQAIETQPTVNWTGSLAVDIQIALSATGNSFTCTNCTMEILG